jgi:hypothetical protein
MVARVLYFGKDSCHRLPVLAAAGLTVEHCPSIAQLSHALATSHEPHAVFFCDHDGRLPEDGIALVRTHPAVRVILFRESNHLWNETDLDLVIPLLTPPPSWLRDIAKLFESPHRRHLVHPQPQPETLRESGSTEPRTAPDASAPGPASARPSPMLPPRRSPGPDDNRSSRSA